MSSNNLLPVTNAPVPNFNGDVKEWAEGITAYLSDATAYSSTTSAQLPIYDNQNRVIVNTDGLHVFDSLGNPVIAADIVQIDTTHLVDAAVTTQKIGNLAVDTSKLADLAVEAAKLANSSVESTKIANAAVGSAAIANAAVGTAHIANAAITSALIGDAQVITAKIDDAAINNSKIANLAVDAAKIANSAITNAKIQNAAIDNLKITNSLNSNDFAFTPGVTATGWEIFGAQSGAGYITANVLRIVDDSGNDVLYSDGSSNTGSLVDQINNQAGTPVFYQTTEPATTGPDGSVWIHSTTRVMKVLRSGTWENFGFSEQITTSNISTYIAGAAIGTAQIANAAIVNALIDDAAITSAKIGTAAITSAKIGDTIQSTDWAYTANVSAAGWRISGTQTGGGLFEGSQIRLYNSSGETVLDSDNYTGKLVTDIADAFNNADWVNVVNKPTLGALAALSTITATEISDNAVTTPKINAGAVNSDKLAANSVIAGKIATNAITAGTIAAGAIATADIANNAVTQALIAAGAIDTTELADGAVLAAKIANGTITASEIATATITGTLIAGSTIATGNIAANAITTALIDTNAVTANEIAAGTITASEIAANAITATQINADAVTTAKIAADAITSTELAAGAVTAELLQVQSTGSETGNDSGLAVTINPYSESPIEIKDTNDNVIFGVQFDGTTPKAIISGTASAGFTNDISAISEAVLKVINPDYLGASDSDTYSNASASTGQTDTQTVDANVEGTINLKFRMSVANFYDGPTNQNYTAPEWTLVVRRNNSSGTILVNKTFTGTASNTYDGEAGQWHCSYNLTVDDGYVDEAATADATNTYWFSLTRVSGTPTTLNIQEWSCSAPGYTDRTNAFDETATGGYSWTDHRTGFTIKMGSVSCSGNSTASVTFTDAFNNWYGGSATSNTTNVGSDTGSSLETLSGTGLTVNNANGSTVTVWWVAFGKTNV